MLNSLIVIYGLVFASALILVEAAFQALITSRRHSQEVQNRLEALKLKVGTDAAYSQLLNRRGVRGGDDESLGTMLWNFYAQSGLETSVPRRIMYAVVLFIIGFAVTDLFITNNLFVKILFGVVLLLLVAFLVVYFARARRIKKFTAQLAPALDIIVRGVSAGLPLSECLKTIANEAREPVRSEFNQLINDQSVGIPLEKACHRLAVRVPLPETSFFAIVLAVQSRSGGSLSEILTNLSTVVRGRKMLDAQIQTMSAEAKMSGRIIGAMPLLVAASLFYLSPDYITILTTTTVGNLILAGCLFWMFTGVMVMKKMINFKV